MLRDQYYLRISQRLVGARRIRHEGLGRYRARKSKERCKFAMA